MEYSLIESLAITRAPASESGYFVLFYLDKDGKELSYDEECGTIDYAYEQARLVMGVERDEWRECRQDLPAGDQIDLSGVC
jgi:hypothetical protein